MGYTGHLLHFLVCCGQGHGPNMAKVEDVKRMVEI